jgi:AcrR family transcriptional regulator
VSEFAFAPGAATPRKRTTQDRSHATVRAILDAALQVLEADGAALTTTRVAEVAGVSVGTLYQYFPHRDALLTGVLADHLEIAIAAVEDAAAAARDRPIAEAVIAGVRAFLAVKRARAPVSRALNRAFGVGLLDDRPVVRAAARRGQRAVAALLAGGGEPDAATLQRAGVACAALEGVVHAAIQDDLSRFDDPAWIDQITAMALAACAVPAPAE